MQTNLSSQCNVTRHTKKFPPFVEGSPSCFVSGASIGQAHCKPRRRWEDGIRIDLREETGWESVDWIQLAQDRDRWRAVVNTVMNLRVLEPLS
jgi:hypothetical protein